MKESILKDKALDFAAKVIQHYPKFLLNNKENVIAKQLLRSGTSIGANINEAIFASSKPDFINKLHIALKECNESIYWIELIIRVKTDAIFSDLLSNVNEIKAMLIASLNTSKKNSIT